jgi:hypothetical protein
MLVNKTSFARRNWGRCHLTVLRLRAVSGTSEEPFAPWKTIHGVRVRYT